MRRFLAFWLAVSLLVLAGCGTREAEPSQPEPPAVTAPDIDTPTTSPDEPAENTPDLVAASVGPFGGDLYISLGEEINDETEPMPKQTLEVTAAAVQNDLAGFVMREGGFVDAFADECIVDVGQRH